MTSSSPSGADISAIPSDPIWVDTTEELARLCQQWSAQAAIAVDTEFMRSQTFYPHAGLLQVGDGKGCYLIDPLAIDDLTPLRDLFTNSAVTKVIHACSEDLEVFNYLLGVLPTPLFDTQVAAAFADYGFSVGYAGLVKAVLGIEVAKGETRSDWMQRPLSQSQMHYAALDVAYLLIVYGKLLQRLKASDRLEWVRSDCADLITAAGQISDHDEYFQKVKSAWKLSRQELAILQPLCRWREIEARERDLPRNRLVKEPALFEMARSKPRAIKQLAVIDGVPSRTMRSDGEELLDIIAAELNREEGSCPQKLPYPLQPEQGDLLKALKAKSREVAETLAMPPEVLARKKDYEFIVRSGMQGGEYTLSKRLQGWRRSVVGEHLIRVASTFDG